MNYTEFKENLLKTKRIELEKCDIFESDNDSNQALKSAKIYKVKSKGVQYSYFYKSASIFHLFKFLTKNNYFN